MAGEDSDRLAPDTHATSHRVHTDSLLSDPLHLEFSMMSRRNASSTSNSRGPVPRPRPRPLASVKLAVSAKREAVPLRLRKFSRNSGILRHARSPTVRTRARIKVVSNRRSLRIMFYNDHDFKFLLLVTPTEIFHFAL